MPRSIWGSAYLSNGWVEKESERRKEGEEEEEGTLGTPWIYRLCSVRDDLVRRQATWQAAEAASQRASQASREGGVT